jgi:hypothetical protein
MEPEVHFKGTLTVRKPISHDLFEVATTIWRTQRTVTVANLSEAVKVLGVKADRPAIEDMVKVSEALNMICP